jgi:hypothetical protein
VTYELGARFTYAQHVLDDERSPPRDERWLEPAVDAEWWWTDARAPLRLGILSDAMWRLAADSAEHWTSVLAGDVALTLRLSDDPVHVTGWVGPGVVILLDPSDEPTLIAVGGVEAEYAEALDSDLAISFGVAMQRDATALGRLGRAGAVDRASAHVGFSLPDAMQEAVAMDLFVERGVPSDVDDEIAWGGVGINVPLGLIEVDQEITYRMTYSALIDQARFGDAAQEMLTAMIWASSWF